MSVNIFTELQVGYEFMTNVERRIADIILSDPQRVTELSMSAGYIPPVRKVLQAVSMDDARALAERVRGYGASRAAAEIYAECRALVLSKVPEFEEMQAFFTAG